MSETPTPETDSVTRSFDETPWTPWVCAGHAMRLERERDEAREENKKFREALEWISKRYDDSKPIHQVAMDAYEMSCTAGSVLQK